MALIKLNDRAVKDATTFGSISSLGEMKFISKATASASASIEFSLGDYKEYQFYFVNMHPATDQVGFQFNMSTDSGSNYNVTKTSTLFIGYQNELGTASGLIYNADNDLAQSTSDHNIVGAGSDLGNANDDSCSGEVFLFNPSSTTFVKHFITKANSSSGEGLPFTNYTAGYGNTTSAITGVKFVMSSGNIDAGTIKLYGIKDS